MSNTNNTTGIVLGTLLGTVVLCAVIAGGMWGCPQYNVYNQKMQGQAKIGRTSCRERV